MISVSVRGTAAGEAVIIRHYTRTPRSIVTRVAACSSSGWGAPLAPDSPTEGRTAIGATSSLPGFPYRGKDRYRRISPLRRILAKVTSPNPQRPLSLGDGNRSSCPEGDLRVTRKIGGQGR